ncbi:hypothetical protein PAHAL_5G149600 [Panicum hallii]|uniref:Viral late gene transcription factor 3 zinc ribbon domain-containing protein n=1 Tax=Panicum hallii TaxID=206008 RepID=A0A2T8IK17_9POAL|nr:uncharacterized protein LOC112891901 isoform X1 [Panicum hallii]PVH38009.1 hypothetical protein PAHAL_5G149600 [Panicum hallii]
MDVRATHHLTHTGCGGVPEGRARGRPCGAAAAKLVAMQARPFPACLPGLAGGRCRRSGLLPSTGRVSRRAPAGRGVATSVRAVDGASAAAAVAAAADAPLPPPQVTWQIVVGAVAGVTPFVVAGIEFSKRIFAQKKCEVCGGSGLVMKNDYYVRCQGCGGFLPWQSWRRFFTG